MGYVTIIHDFSKKDNGQSTKITSDFLYKNTSLFFLFFLTITNYML